MMPTISMVKGVPMLRYVPGYVLCCVLVTASFFGALAALSSRPEVAQVVPLPPKKPLQFKARQNLETILARAGDCSCDHGKPPVLPLEQVVRARALR